MGTVARGHRLYAQLGKQVTPGTQVVAATGPRFELIGFNLSPNQGSAEDPSLIDGLLSPRGIFQFGRHYAGRMSGRLGYLGLLKIFNAIMGDGASPATPATTGPVETSVMTHTFKQGFTLPIYSAQVFEGGYDALTTVARYDDFALENLEITGEAVQSGEGGIFKWSADTAARIHAANSAPTSLSLVGDPETAVFSHGQTMVDGLSDAAIDFECKAFTLRIGNPIDKERYQIGTSLQPNAFERQGRQLIELELKLGWQKNTQLAALEAWTDAVPQLILRGPTIIPGASTLKREIEFKIPKAKVVEVSRPIELFGTIYQTVKYRAYYDATTTTGLTIRVQNESATVAAG